MSFNWGNLFGQRDVRETATTTVTSSGAITDSSSLYVDTTSLSGFQQQGGNVSVTVGAGQKVMLFCTGRMIMNEGDGTATFYLRRSTTQLTTTNFNVSNGDVTGNSATPFALHWVDTTPGTGTITYNLYGNSLSQPTDFTITAIVI